jgi:Xaa-Pro aminopeptidase
MADIHRPRAQSRLQALQVDALVLAKPESFTWATDCHPGVAAFFRRAGAALALVPTDASEPTAAVVTELFAGPARLALGDAQVRTHVDWVETADIRPGLLSHPEGDAATLVTAAHHAAGRPEGFTRPAVFDARQAFAALGSLLQEKGFLHSRIGLDMDFWPVSDFHALQQALPSVRWVDASAAVSDIKAVKSAAEITRLTQAAALAEAGMRAALESLHTGIHRDAIANAWKQGVAREVECTGAKLTGQWEYTTVGALPWQGGGALQAGDVLKFDVGCLVEGYSSDSGRTYVWGHARPRTRAIMDALEDAFAAGLEVLRPGFLLSDVHARAQQALHKAGFTSFTRGHFGHSLGHDTFCETAPFIAAQAHTPIETGMVLAFETPLYVDGEGGFIIEDQFVITDTGPVAAWSLPRALSVLG